MLHRDERGQALILLALAMTGMLASVGLAVDVGQALARSRILQNATDAGALVGARAVAKGDLSATARDITDYAERNGVPDTDGTAYDGVNGNVSWSYIDNAGNAATPLTATGVRVEASIAVPTLFLRVIGISSIVVARRSTALVEQLAGVGATAPFAVYERQGPLDLLTRDADGHVTGLNPAAIGQTVLIHGPQVDDPFGPNSFKGLLPTDYGPLAIGDSVPYEPGVHAGPTREEVKAIGTSYLILPIFDDRDAALNRVHIVAFAVYEVQEIAPNKHTGRLLEGTFIGNGRGTRTFVPGSTFDVVTLKLVF